MKFSSFTIVRKQKLLELRKRVKTLENQVQTAQSFIREIERGNLNVQLQTSTDKESSHDALAESLLSMRRQMNKIAEDEKKRNWATEGLAKFVDILRSKNDDLKALGEVIIHNIVRYMDANQGSLFILNDEDKADIHLEMIACYAYNRKKHLDQKIGLGQGLTGQAVLEKETIYMTNIPDNYLKITSGLGEALPKNLMIVPLILNNAAFGVIELASFQIFEAHHREFIEKLAESIASTILNVKVNQQTRRLLEETQAQAEQMRAQEEEMRQNMEELTATQEEIQRVLKEVQGKEGYINQLLNVSADPIFTFDQQFRLVTWNMAFESTMSTSGFTLGKGASTLDWHQGDERAKQMETYKRALRGEIFETTTSSEANGVTNYFITIYAPLQNELGEIHEAAAFVKDVTTMMASQKNAEKLASDAQQQAEELKAQEEELRQNMEELSATQDEMQRVMKEMEAREEYANQLLNVNSDSIFTIDREYRLMTWNTTFAAVFEKYGMKVAKGISTLDWYQGAEREAQKKLYDRALSGETFDFTMSSKLDGSATHYLSVYAPLKSAEGHIYEVAIFVKDVTAIVKTQKKGGNEKFQVEQHTKEVQEKESYLQAILNASSDAIFTVDRNYNLLSFNQGFSDEVSRLGIKVEKGLNIMSLLPTEQDKRQQAVHYSRAFSGESFEVTSRFDHGGMTARYSNRFSPLRNTAGEVYALVIYGRDVTEFTSSESKAASDGQSSGENTRTEIADRRASQES